MILTINTSDLEWVSVGLTDGQVFFDQDKFSARYQQAEKLLPRIDKMLRKNRINLNKLKMVVVANGPGPFTALRIGVVTANALADSLKIPILGLPTANFENQDELLGMIRKNISRATSDAVEPAYGQEPNITKKK